jgi:hypothetical protein
MLSEHDLLQRFGVETNILPKQPPADDDFKRVLDMFSRPGPGPAGGAARPPMQQPPPNFPLGQFNQLPGMALPYGRPQLRPDPQALERERQFLQMMMGRPEMQRLPMNPAMSGNRPPFPQQMPPYPVQARTPTSLDELISLSNNLNMQQRQQQPPQAFR